MNEEHLADILSEHLDMLLAGQPLPTELPAEVAELLPLAQNLVASVPAPRPDFGPALKSRLLPPPPGPNGSGGSAGPTSGGLLPFIGAAGFLVVVGGILLGGLFWLGLLQSPGSAESSPTLPPPSTPARPAQPAGLPLSTPVSPLVTGSAADSLIPSVVSPTAILDVLPPLTATVESAQEIHLPIDLVPGESSSSDSGDGNSGGSGEGGSGRSGDHNRGHGNDDDHDDDDNPGHD